MRKKLHQFICGHVSKGFSTYALFTARHKKDRKCKPSCVGLWVLWLYKAAAAQPVSWNAAFKSKLFFAPSLGKAWDVMGIPWCPMMGLFIICKGESGKPGLFVHLWVQRLMSQLRTLSKTTFMLVYVIWLKYTMLCTMLCTQWPFIHAKNLIFRWKKWKNYIY